MMKTARLLLLIMVATLSPAIAQTWDTSGNGMLKGQYFFREVYYVVGDPYGDLGQAVTLYNTITFDGNGKYTGTAGVVNTNSATVATAAISGTYSIAASGFGFISNPAPNSGGDRIYGLVSQSGVFVGSSTYPGGAQVPPFNDLFIAAPVGATPATNATFKGTYSVAHIDLGNVVNPYGAGYGYGGSGAGYALGDTFQLTPDGAGNLGTVTFTGYNLAYYGAVTQTSPGLKYSFANGYATIPIPLLPSTLISGQFFLYISPDGNFIFGGSRTGYDFFVGVRMDSTAQPLSGLYYEAGLDENESLLVSSYGGAALLDTYYGSFNAGGGTIVGHQEVGNVLQQSTTQSAIQAYTYYDSYNVPANGTYTSGNMSYAVGAGGTIRIGSGVGPFLGISVALAAPAVSGSGVWINPQGIVNAASFAPFTAGIAPGELITIYGSNLASGQATAPGIPFPTSLGGVQVSINNTPAPIYYVTPGQISVIVPYGVTGSVATIQVTNNGTQSNTVTAFVNATSPGVFTIPNNGISYAAALHADYSLVTTQSPAKIGETISVFLTGLGAVNPTITDGDAGPSATLAKATNPIGAYVSGAQAKVTYAGLAPDLAGLYQVNLTIPTGITAGNNNVLDIFGPDAYTSEALIPIGAASTTGSAMQGAAAPAVAPANALRPGASRPGAMPRYRRPLPCLPAGASCGGSQE